MSRYHYLQNCIFCSGIFLDQAFQESDIFLQTKLIDKNEYSKFTTLTESQAGFYRKITASEDAFSTFCKVLMEKRCTRILFPYIQVQSCGYLSQFETLYMLDKAIVERNKSVNEFLEACFCGEKARTDGRKIVTSIVIGASTTGFVGGCLVIAGLVLAPFSFGASLGLSIAGGALGICTGLASGAARVVDVTKENSTLNEIEKLQRRMHENELKVSREMENFENLFKTTLNKGQERQSKAFGRSKNWILAVGSAARIAPSIASIAAAAARLGSVAAAVTASVLGPLSLIFDIAFLAEAAHNKRKGDKTSAGNMLRNMREIVEIKCKIFNNMLRGDCEESKIIVEPFLD